MNNERNDRDGWKKTVKTGKRLSIVLILSLLMLVLGRGSGIVYMIFVPVALICIVVLLMILNARIGRQNKERAFSDAEKPIDIEKDKTGLPESKEKEEAAKAQPPKDAVKAQPPKEAAIAQPSDQQEKLSSKTENRIWPKPKIYSDKPLPAPKYICSGSGKNMYYAGASYEEVLEEYLKSVLNKESLIHAIMKSGKDDTYTLINFGGPFRDYLEKEIASKKAEKSGIEEGLPAVININALDEEALKKWCKGEEKERERIIWITDKYGNTESVRIKRAQLDEKAKSWIGSNKVAYIERYGLKSLIKTEVERHDLKHDPWNPVYPDLSGLTLRDLQVSREEPERGGALFDEAKLREKVNRFFGNGTDKKIELIAGDNDVEAGQEKAFCRMLDFGRCWVDVSRARVWENAPVYCITGEYKRLDEWETPCWDGGNCGTDTEYDGIVFARYDENTDKWESLVESTSNGYWYRNKDREELLESWKEYWGFAGCQEELSTPFVIDGHEMYLLDPFGMKGIYSFRRI